MVTPLSQMFLREIPAHLVAGINRGDYQVFGSVIKSATSGQILGHLQETSALTSILSKTIPGLSTAVEMGAQAVTIAQNEQIKSALSFVQSLQLANLAVGAASIGVSVAGTALLSAQIRQLETKLDGILPELQVIARGVEQLRNDRIAEDFTRLKVLAGQVDECWILANANSEWRAIARDADFLAGSFARRAQEALGQPTSGPDSAEALVDAYSLSSSLRVTARMASDDLDAAYHAACERVHTLLAISACVSVSTTALTFAAVPHEKVGRSEWAVELDHNADQIKASVHRSQARAEAAAATAETIETLSLRKISGREWLEAAREEAVSPTLFLPH